MLDIAVVGIGCRFSGGVTNPVDFWKFLTGKGDGIIEVPPDRWSLDRFYDADPDAPGRMYIRQGGFLTEPLWDFDPEFFGIAPREASIMDPQQRMLLEVAVEALDDAGLAGQVGGRDVGVYVGGFTSDNMAARHSPRSRWAINSHTPTSGTFTMLSNRLSYVLDLHGPSMTIDTACSSSLVAIHEAAQAVARGECEMAIAGGVNAMIQPETFISMCKGRFLSPDGRCKSFDAAADGYGRGEGCGVIVLKPLAAAQADGDRVYAVVRATGANQDGRTSGITVPNPVAQAALARRVVAESGIDPAAIGYVEAHGTGTAIGDPLELSALGAVYGAATGRTTPLVVGSVKASIGHTEAAAGVAGVIKAALTVHHRTVAPQARLDTLNPAIPFDELGIRVPTEVEPFPDGPRDVPAVAVNSFGYGGTNAHLILEAAPAAEPVRPVVATGTRVFPLSGRTEAAVREGAARFADLVAAVETMALYPESDVDQLTDAAWTRRVHHPFRAPLTFTEPAELLEKLRAVAEGATRAGTRTVVRDGVRPVFVFTGMGPQWWGMARDLLQADGAFATSARWIDEVFRTIAGWSIIDELLAPEGSSRITSTAFAQPANFLVQVALCTELAAAGVTPAAVLGHSVGEVSAAYVSGALSLRDALLVSYHRARLQATTAGTGGMLAVGLPEDEALARLLPGSAVEVAAVNSPSAVTLAGDTAELTALAERLTEDGVFARALRVEVPYHSHLMDPILPEVAEVLAGVHPAVPQLPLYSSVTGRQVTDASWDAAYWCENVRRTVRFADAVGTLVDEGHRVFVEVGPHPVLGGNIREILVRAGETGTTVATLTREQPDEPQLARALGELWAAGCLEVVRPDGRSGPGPHVALPAYPWQRTRIWTEDAAHALDRLGSPDVRPMLGERTEADQPEWETALSSTTLPWLSDHVVDGVVLLPGAAYLDAALTAAAALTEQDTQALAEVRFIAPLVIDEHDVPSLRVSVEPSTRRLRVRSRSAGLRDWTVNASARIVAGRFTPDEHDFTPPAGARRVDADELYASLGARGLAYGPAFRGVVEAWVGADRVVARVDPKVAPGGGHLAHPAITDAALQCIAALVAADPDAPTGAVVPAGVASVRRFADVPAEPRVLVRRLDRPGLWADVAIGDEQGVVALELRGVEFRPVRPAATALERVAPLFYELGWQTRPPRELPPAAAAAEATVVVTWGDGSPLAPLAEIVAVGRIGAQIVALSGDADTLLDGVAAARVAAAIGRARREPGAERVVVVAVAGAVAAPGIDGVAALLAVANGIAAAGTAEGEPPVYAVVLTERAFALPGDRAEPDYAQAALVGVRRTLRNEQQDAIWRHVDVVGSDVAARPRLLLDELVAGPGGMLDDVDETALRDGIRMIMSLSADLPGLHASLAEPRPMIDPERSYRLEAPRSMLLADLALREIARTAPGPGQIEVRMTSVGLGYKDPLKVMGLLGDAQMEGTFFGTGMGMEAQGTVVRLGEGVTEYAVGDQVVVGVRDAASRYLTVDTDGEGLVGIIPDTWSEVGSASLVAFLTAHQALVRAARVAPGETVLIHGAAGGVGLAAVQVALRRGARVIGTAGSDERRAHVLGAGAEHVLDSRSLNFVEDVRALTGGRGVDVVLNSAPGEVAAANLAVVTEFGRVVEIGKADIFQAGVLDLAPFNRNLTFTSLDIDRMFAHSRAALNDLVQEVLAEFRSGGYVELPTVRFPMSRAAEAMEMVATSGQIGRVALTFDDEAPMVRPPVPECRIVPAATYLVTGGFGDVGLATARWLVASGARHLALVGRRGATTRQAKAALAAFAAAGVEVVELRADVADAAEVAAMVNRVTATMPPLRGVFHGAGVLDDRPFGDVDAASIRRVLEPKAAGALHLDAALDGVELDHFVVYSSAAGLIGNVPQATYCAANTVLDTLAASRRARGLPALSIVYGSLEGGMASSSEEVVRYLELVGMTPVSMELAMEAMAQTLAVDVPHVAIIDLDWARWGATHPLSAPTARFAEHVAAAGAGGSDAARLREELAKLPEEQRAEVLGFILAEQLSEVLGIPADALDLATPLPDLGLDSLMAVDLGARINLTLGVEISALEFSRGLGLGGLARKILPTLAAAGV